MFDWNDLKLLLAAYRTRSLGKAAAQLGVSVSTMSRRIEALEEQLGVVLFARTPDGLVPEAAATELVAHAIEAEQAAERVGAAARAARSRVASAIRIAVPPDFSKVVMPLVLSHFFARHPDTTIELVEAADLSDMPRREADIAIRARRPERGDDLVVARLLSVHFGLFASPRYLATVPRPLDPLSMRWVVWAHPGAARSDWLEAHCPAVKPVLRCSDPTTARLAIAYGVGAGVVSRTFARVTPWLEEVDVGLPPIPDAALWLVGHKAMLALSPVRTVWDFLLDTLRTDDDALVREIEAHATPADP